EQERGQTDGEHLAYDGSDEAERTALEVQEVFAVEEMDEFEYERHALPGDGGDSRTAHAPAEPEDEERVEADDDEHGGQHDANRLFRVARSAQDFVHPHIDVRDDIAGQNDAHEAAGVGNGLVAGSEKVEDV